MAKRAIFVTTDKQAESSIAVLSERGEDIPIYITHPLRVPTEAMDIVRREGIQVIIARGGVAKAFRQCTDLPIIDLVLTAQELGMLIVEAKKILHKQCPTIALITHDNMLGDMSDAETLFGAKLNIYLADSLEEMGTLTHRAAAEGADLAIGGQYVKAACGELGMPYLDNPPGKVSVRNALQIADQVSYSIDLQERINSESSALLNFSFNGIIKLDRAGAVVAMNHRAESMLDSSISEMKGRHISECIAAVDADRLSSEVFGEGEELFFTFRRDEDSFAVSIAPIKNGAEVEGAIVSCYDIEGMSSFEREARSNLNSGSRPKYTYKWLSSMAEEHAPFLKTMNEQAQYDEVLLIYSPNSLERSACARFAYSNGLRRDLPYQEISAASYAPDEQIFELFGSDGVLAAVNGGTLFLDEVEALSPQCQQRLCRLIRDGQLVCSGGVRAVDVRIIAGTAADLEKLCNEGLFRRDLYYTLTGRVLHVPGLTNCPNAIAKWASYYMDKYCAAYGRFTALTKPAKRALGASPWPGGHAQLQAFCRKAASESCRRSLDDTAVARLLAPVSEEVSRPAAGELEPDKARLQQLIDKYGGNRARIADEMRISKTTLWRRMKEYGLL